MYRRAITLGAYLALACTVSPFGAAGQSVAEFGAPSAVDAFLRGPVSEPTGAISRGVMGDRYVYGTLALGVPSAIVSALNLSDGGPSNVWLGLAGIGLGVGHGAMFVAGLGEERTPRAASTLNALASVYSTVSGVLQIRSTFGDGPKPSSFRASVTPRMDGVRLRMTWKPAR
jgi:hypothetical protein